MDENYATKKCGIVTLYDDNFGTCLQAFALYTKIKECGYKPIIIRYKRENRPVSQSNNSGSKINKLKNASPKMLFEYAISYKNIRDRKVGFSKFRNKYLEFTAEVNYRDYIADDTINGFDGYVCGSDMIWSEEFADDWNYFYLNFAPECKRIAYAPSFGKNEISINNRSLCGKLLEGIKYISCREVAGTAMLKQYYGMRVQQVVDPTLLLTKDDWDALMENNQPILEDKYILTYVFGGITGGREKIFSQIQNRKWGVHKIIPMNRSQYGKDSVNGILGPKEFINLYKNAEFIVTDTFHGLIFALIYEKPFVVLKREDGGHWAKYSDRMTSTLSMLGLEERYIDSNAIIPDKFNYLDYTTINDKLKIKRDESFSYLKNSLEGVMH